MYRGKSPRLEQTKTHRRLLYSVERMSGFCGLVSPTLVLVVPSVLSLPPKAISGAVSSLCSTGSSQNSALSHREGKVAAMGDHLILHMTNGCQTAQISNSGLIGRSLATEPWTLPTLKFGSASRGSTTPQRGCERCSYVQSAGEKGEW